MKKSVLTFVERMAIHERLKVLLLTSEPGTCQYPDGHSDATVAAEFKCSPNNVSGLRQEVFGHLRAPSKADVYAAMNERVEELTTRCAVQGQQINALYAVVLRLAAGGKLEHLKEVMALRQMFGSESPTVRG